MVIILPFSSAHPTSFADNAALLNNAFGIFVPYNYQEYDFWIGFIYKGEPREPYV